MTMFHSNAVLVTLVLLLCQAIPNSVAASTSPRRPDRATAADVVIPPCDQDTHSTSVCPDDPSLIQICQRGLDLSTSIELCVSSHSWSSRYRRGDSCGACPSTKAHKEITHRTEANDRVSGSENKDQVVFDATPLHLDNVEFENASSMTRNLRLSKTW